MRDVVSAQFVRVEHDLVLPHHAADTCHFGHVRHSLQFVFEKPVLQCAQLRQIHFPGAVYQCVLVNPAHTGGIGPQRGFGLRRQTRLHLIEVFEHAGASPVRIGAVLEQDVDERIAEE